MTDAKQQTAPWHQGVPTSIRKPVLAGLLCLGLSGLGFGVWAATAPLSSAAVARGVVVATGQNKIIQHLEGGIIAKILVKEGDTIAAGQLLIRLEETSAKAHLRRLELGRYRNLAMRARLEAERTTRPSISIPKSLEKGKDRPDIAEIITRQELEFAARRAELDDEITIIRQRISAVREEITGLEAQRVAVTSQRALIEQEIAGQETLRKKGLATLGKLLALKRSQARLIGQSGELTAQIGRAKERIAEAESQIRHARSKRVEEAVRELRETEGKLGDLEEQIKSATDILSRLEIRSPVDGIVVKLAHHTPGGVVKPGEDVLELLPVKEELLIEAYVRPDDIDVVQKGDRAQLRFVALKQRTTPVLHGQVSYVSADRIEGRRTDESYYVARIRLDGANREQVAALNVAAGMPVEVYIVGGERTFFEYLAAPISDSFQRAFREE